MAKTCAGYDNSAPQDVLTAVKVHLKNQNTGRTFLDEEGCCMLSDLGAKPACDDLNCKYDGKPRKNHPERPKDRL